MFASRERDLDPRPQLVRAARCQRQDEDLLGRAGRHARGEVPVVGREEVDGDVLLHFSVLREHGRRSVPEGATVECLAARQERGLQALRVLSIDLSSALPAQPNHSRSSAERANRKALSEAAGEFEPVEVKWFNRVRGYGFVNRTEQLEDVFLHMETVRQAGIGDLQPGQKLEARIAAGRKGLTAVEVRDGPSPRPRRP